MLARKERNHSRGAVLSVAPASSTSRARSTPSAPASSSSASSRGVSQPAAARVEEASRRASAIEGAARASGNRGLLFQPTALLVVLQRGGQLVELAHQDPVEVVQPQPDPVVGYAPLGKVVGPDL